MPERIRILLVVDNLDVGGIREVVLTQLRGLDPEHFDTGLLTLDDDLDRLDDTTLPDHVERFGVKYRTEYGYGLLDYLADGVLLRSAKTFGPGVQEQIRAFGPDILHFHTLPRNLGLGILARRSATPRLVFTDHLMRIRRDDYAAHSRAVLGFAYRRLYRHYNVICVGPAVEACNRSFRFLNRHRRHLLLENQIDVQTFRPPTGGRPDSPPGAPVEIINVARIQEVKGHDTLIRAFAAIPDGSAATLTLVGPDAMKGSMQQLAEDVVDAPREVQFLGSRSDVPDLLRGASIGVLASRREGLPLALLEMMASGLPVVVSDIPELKGVVSDGIDGLIVPVDDVPALSEALTRLVEDPDLRRRLGAGARAMAERHMAVDAIGLLEDFYRGVVEHG